MIRATVLRIGFGAALAFLFASACRREPNKVTAPVRPTIAATAVAPIRRAPELDAVIRAYRQTIVLMSGEAGLPPGDRPNAFVAGKLLFHANRVRLAELARRLFAELDAAAMTGGRAPELEGFLAALETNGSWRDADKLAFRDLVLDLADRAGKTVSPVSGTLRSRLEDDRKALDEIRRLYDRELEKIFGQFETRGMPVRRESWESYLGSLRALFTPADVLAELRSELASIATPAPSGILTGSTLPAKTLALTFDDGPHARHTAEILAILAKFGVKAVFFQVGQNLGKISPSGEVTRTAASGQDREVLAAGHLLANHTYSHAFLPLLTGEKLAQELDTTSRLLPEPSSGGALLFRPPYGAWNAAVRTAAEARRMRMMLWTIDSQDWADPVPKSIANRVIADARAHGHGVVLFHDIHSQTVEALPLVLETLAKEGFRFVLWDGSRVLDRGPDPAVAAASPPPTAPPLYRESWAVVVGIQDYAIWPKLSYAVRDALSVRDTLVNRFGFKPENVFTLLDGDATRERVLSLLGDTLASQKRVQRDDRVFVFFAGHGATRELPSGRSLGYIVPVEAGTQSYHGQAISMTNFQDVAEAIPAKHVLFVMDACYSGLALVRGGPAGGATAKYLLEITRRGTRQMLTAGGADQQVADNGPGGHSIFTWTLLQGLEGKADLNGDGFVTATELAAYITPIVSSLSRQTPAFGSMAGSEGGDFVFELKHESEFLSAGSKQLDDDAIRVNEQIDTLKKEVADMRARNSELARALALARGRGSASAGPATVATAEMGRKQSDRGLALYREKRYAEALDAFKDALRLAPNNAQVANNTGFVCYRLERYDEALAWYRKALELDPRRAIAWANSGEVYEKTGSVADAIQSYEKFLEMVPKHPSAGYVRSRLGSLRGEN